MDVGRTKHSRANTAKWPFLLGITEVHPHPNLCASSSQCLAKQSQKAREVRLTLDDLSYTNLGNEWFTTSPAGVKCASIR